MAGEQVIKSGVGAARRLVEELGNVIAKRKAVLKQPAQIEAIAKKYGLSPEVTKQYIEGDLALSIKRRKAAKDYQFQEQKYNTTHSDAPYTRAAVDAYKRKETLRQLAFT